MLHRIAVSNFYCIRDSLEINLTVTDQAPDLPERFAQPTTTETTRIPKVVGLYGPNASGKSTILRALGFVGWYIQHGFRLPPNAPIVCQRFNSKSHLREPIRIEIEFDAPVELVDTFDMSRTCRYVYSLVLDGGAEQPAHIQEEQLWYWPPDAVRRVRIFERNKEGVQAGARAFQLMGYAKAIPKVLRPNVSLISTLAQLGHEPSIVLQTLAGRIETNIIVERYDPHEGWTAQNYLDNKRLFGDLNREISRFDLGITDVVIEKPKGEKGYPNPTFTHRGLAGPLAIGSESEGTRQFFKIFPMLSQALHFGGVAVIDEFDSSIHPLILPEIIRWFYDPKRNAKNAQLWFTAQNPYLLRVLEKEEIILCEKDDGGGSTAFRLSDVKAVRRNENYLNKYLSGIYGAVPHIG